MTQRRAGAAALSWAPAALAAGYVVVFRLAPDPGGAAWRVLGGPLEPMQADSRPFVAFDPGPAGAVLAALAVHAPFALFALVNYT